MKKSIAILIVSISLASISFGQKISGKLKFQKGQTLEITTEIKTTISQQAMEQAIDITTNGSILHLYKVISTATNNTSLHHEVKKISFSIDGMGKKINFNSDNADDMNKQIGKPIKSELAKTFEMTIDANGKVIAVTVNGTDNSQVDPQMMMMITSMLNTILGVAEPPQKDDQSFFQVLPPAEVSVGETWADSVNNDSERSTTTYKLSGITDSTILIDFNETSIIKTKAEMMGMETTTTLNNKTSGKIILNKSTNIILQKTSATDSNGNTEVMGNNIPITSKASVTINVKLRK